MSQNKQLALPGATVTPLTELLEKRRSTRTFAEAGIQMTELAHLLRAAVGLRTDRGSVVPSAHSLSLLSVGIVAGGVENLRPGATSIYRVLMRSYAKRWGIIATKSPLRHW